MSTTTKSKKSAKKVQNSGLDVQALAAMLAGGSAEDLANVANAAKAAAKAKKAEEKAAENAKKAEEKAAENAKKAKARLRNKCGAAVLESVLYTNKRGAMSRKVFLSSDQKTTMYGKTKEHKTCLFEADIVALAHLIREQGAESVCEVILKAAADKDGSIAG